MSNRAHDERLPWWVPPLPREVTGLLAVVALLVSCTVTTRQPPQDRRSSCDPVAVRVDNQAFEEATLRLDGRTILRAPGKTVTLERVCRWRFHLNQRNWSVDFLGVARTLRLTSDQTFDLYTRGVDVRLPVRAYARIPEASQVSLLRPEE